MPLFDPQRKFNWAGHCYFLPHVADRKGCDMPRGSISLAALLWLVIAFLVLYPLSILVLESFKIAETGGWGIGNYIEFFQDPYYLKTFVNTLFLSTLVLLTTTVFGVPLA